MTDGFSTSLLIFWCSIWQYHTLSVIVYFCYYQLPQSIIYIVSMAIVFTWHMGIQQQIILEEG